MTLLEFIILVPVLVCGEAKIENKTTEWNQNDQRVFELQRVECRRRFKRSPCVARFVKKGYNDYYVSCGERRTK